MIYCYNDQTGQILQVVEAPSDHKQIYQDMGFGVLVSDDHLDQSKYMIENGVAVRIPDPPTSETSYYLWNWETHEWVANLFQARADVTAEIERVRSQLASQPIEYENSPFDANAIARERITGTIARIMRGDGLPAGWIGWRDSDNEMHWALLSANEVLVKLRGLSSAIEDREQLLLIKAWLHKANIHALFAAGNQAGLISYDVYSNWS